MARITTYRQLSQQIIDAHYNGVPQPEAPITQRMVAERIAMLVAKAAVKSAYGNSNLTEATYSNDQFISVFNNCPLLTDTATGNKYVVMPATPAGLPNGREIAQVSFYGYPNVWCVPESNRYAFISAGLPPIPSTDGVQKFKVENGNIVFENLPAIITANVNLKLVGAVPPGTTILDSNLNVPKDVESDIYETILQQLAVEYRVQPENINIGEPTA